MYIHIYTYVALRATTMSPACATMAPLQYIVSPELSLRIRAFHQKNMSGNSNDLYNAFNMSATSQATAGDSPAFRGPYGQNGVTTRQSPPTSGEHEALIANSFSGPTDQELSTDLWPAGPLFSPVHTGTRLSSCDGLAKQD